MMLRVSESRSFQACDREGYWVLFCLSYYTSEMFELVENILYAYADDFTLLAIILKPADRPATQASLTGTWLGFRSDAITGA